MGVDFVDAVRDFVDGGAALRMGVYMGVFNLFIVIPQIVMSLIVPSIFNNVLGGDPRNAVVLGGISLLIGGDGARGAGCSRTSSKKEPAQQMVA